MIAIRGQAILLPSVWSRKKTVIPNVDKSHYKTMIPNLDKLRQH